MIVVAFTEETTEKLTAETVTSITVNNKGDIVCKLPGSEDKVLVVKGVSETDYRIIITAIARGTTTVNLIEKGKGFYAKLPAIKTRRQEDKKSRRKDDIPEWNNYD